MFSGHVLTLVWLCVNSASASYFLRSQPVWLCSCCQWYCRQALAVVYLSLLLCKFSVKQKLMVLLNLILKVWFGISEHMSVFCLHTRNVEYFQGLVIRGLVIRRWTFIVSCYERWLSQAFLYFSVAFSSVVHLQICCASCFILNICLFVNSIIVHFHILNKCLRHCKISELTWMTHHNSNCHYVLWVCNIVLKVIRNYFHTKLRYNLLEKKKEIIIHV